jgi:hypothetical protein
LEIDILSLMGMEVNNDIDEDEGDEVHDVEDSRILDEWQMQRDRVVEDDVEPDDDGDDDDDGDEARHLRELDNIDSDDDSSNDEYTPAILSFTEIISNSCNTILLLLLPYNYVSLQVLVIYLC